MHIDQKFLKESAEIEKTMRQRTTPLVERWSRSGLLEGLSDQDKHTLSQLLQNQTNQLMKEASRTSTQVGHEEWSDIALPMVRKVFVEQLAKQLVHTQAMNMPSGLVFYLDFQLDKAKPAGKPIYDAEESVYGITDTSSDPSKGFYGADRYSYSMNYYSASVTTGLVGSGSVTWAEVAFRDGLSASVAANELSSFDVEVDPAWKADFEAIETFTVDHANVGNVLREFTSLVSIGGKDFVRFIHTGTPVTSGSTANFMYTMQPTESYRGDYEVGQAGVGAIDEVNIKVTQKMMVAKTRKLKTEITPELIQDLNAYQSLDAQKEMTTILSSYIEQEEDTEILNMLSKAARPITRYWSAVPGRYVNAQTGEIESAAPQYTFGPHDWFKTLGIRIRDVSNEIHKRTLRGGANWLVCSPKVATVLESFNNFQVQPSSGGGTFSMGVEQVGTVDGRIKIYKNPYYKENEILLGFKGNNFLESGAAYCQYIPFMLTPPLTDPDDFTVKQGIMTRNAKLVLRSEFYAKILIRDLNTI